VLPYDVNPKTEREDKVRQTTLFPLACVVWLCLVAYLALGVWGFVASKDKINLWMDSQSSKSLTKRAGKSEGIALLVTCIGGVLGMAVGVTAWYGAFATQGHEQPSDLCAGSMILLLASCAKAFVWLGLGVATVLGLAIGMPPSRQGFVLSLTGLLSSRSLRLLRDSKASSFCF
jgi:hypothetical protein